MREVQKRSFRELVDDQAGADLRDRLSGSADQEELRRQNQRRIVIVIGQESPNREDDYDEHRCHNHLQEQYSHNKRMKVSLDSKDKLKIFYKVFETVNRITRNAESLDHLTGCGNIKSMDEMSGNDRMNSSSSSLSSSSLSSSSSSSSFPFASHRSSNSVTDRDHFDLLKKREIVSALLHKFGAIYEY